MPFNLLKKYNELLELGALNEFQRKQSLIRLFDRDFTNNPNLSFKGKAITPTPIDGDIKMSTLFTHLTTEVVDRATKKREFDRYRSVRLHWVRFHIDCQKKDDVIHFSVKEPEGIRTYIYDITEKYVVILEPLRNIDAYYLITAYHLSGKDAKRDKILKKHKRRLKDTI